MTSYLDTSNLVKLFVEEPDSDLVQQLVDRSDVVATSVIAYSEARATFARRRRERLMTAGEARAAVRQLDEAWPHLLVIGLDDQLGRAAGALAEAHALRGCDAIHLASFETLLGSAPGDVEFSCADQRLVRAARRLG